MTISLKRVSVFLSNSNNSNNTNVVYFTTICNLGCTYCYEHLDTAKPKNLSIEQLYKIADDAIERESDKQTMFVLFGGEATLRWDEAEKFMDYAYSKKSDVHFNLITNGIRFLEDEFFKKFFNNEHYNDGRLSIDISFDGVDGNVDRVYKDGSSSTVDVIKVLAKLHGYNLKWRLRYTIHKNNIDHFVKDITNITKHFAPLRVIKNVVHEQLTEDDLIKLEEGYQILKQAWNSNQISSPVCDLFCDSCTGCEKGTGDSGNIADYVSEEPDIHQQRTTEKFNKFEQK